MGFIVSVIIPHFNSPHLLKLLLESIPKRDDFQVIVVDDNSTKSVDILKSVIQSDDRCEFYVNNTGVQSAGAARNVGLEHAKGKWLLFADADDCFADGFEKIIEEYFESDIDVIYFAPTSFVSGTDKFSYRHLNLERRVYDYYLNPNRKNEMGLRFFTHSSWSKMIRKSIVDDNRIYFDETITSNDVMFSAKVGAAAKKIGVSRKIIYIMYVFRGSLTTAVSPESFDTRVTVQKDWYHYVIKYISKKEWDSFGVKYMTYVMHAWKRFGFKKAISTLVYIKKSGLPLGMGYFYPKALFRRIKEHYLNMKDISNAKHKEEI